DWRQHAGGNRLCPDAELYEQRRPSITAQTGLTIAPIGAGPNVYGMYATFTATAHLPDFNPGTTGSVSSFNFTLYADPGAGDVFTLPTTNGGGTNYSVADTGVNDVVLGVATGITGSAGVQAGTGAPIFSATSAFVLCNGVANQGLLGGVLVTGGLAT